MILKPLGLFKTESMPYCKLILRTFISRRKERTTFTRSSSGDLNYLKRRIVKLAIRTELKSGVLSKTMESVYFNIIRSPFGLIPSGLTSSNLFFLSRHI